MTGSFPAASVGAVMRLPVSADFNDFDLVWHELEFRERYSFTYTVHEFHGQYLGCCYLYPMGRRTSLTEDLPSYEAAPARRDGVRL